MGISPTVAPRRARVIDHQLQALRWLEGLVVQDPRPGDSVATWLHPALAARLERAGVPTLVALIERINGIGARWWVQVPGVGERKAARILDWLRANLEVLGMRVGAHVYQPHTQVAPTILAAVVSGATAIVPYEKFVLPADLDGSAGRYRAPREKCLLIAADEHVARGWHPSGRRIRGVVRPVISRRPRGRIARKPSVCCSGRSSNARRLCPRCRSTTPPPAAASSPIRRRPGVARGITSAGRRYGGRSKDR